MIHVTSTITINHPADKTFRFIANPENNPQWQGGMKNCTITSDGPLGIGSTYEQEAEFMGKKILTTFRIEEYSEDHLIKGESIISTFPISFTRIVDGNEDQCAVTAIVTGAPSGLMGLFPFFTRWMIKRSIGKDYQNLKRMLER